MSGTGTTNETAAGALATPLRLSIRSAWDATAWTMLTLGLSLLLALGTGPWLGWPRWFLLVLVLMLGLVFLRTWGLIWQVWGGVTLQDSTGKVRAGLAIAPEQVVLTIYDKNEQKRITLGVRPDGMPSLVFFADNEDPRMVLGFTPEGTPYFAMEDQNLQARVALLFAPSGTPLIGLQDEHGKTRALITPAGVMTFRPDGTSRIWMFDELEHMSD